jgi:glycosyltransferase involved in cell wall biosynthesis
MLRRHIFVECGIPLVANSCWSRQSALDALGTEVSVDVVPLGVDTDCFAPMPRDVARAALGLERSLDDSVPLVVFGSVDTALPEKGGPVLRRVMNLMRHDGVRFACFGHRSEAFDRAIPLGFIADERMMPIVYGAADCYVTLSAVESFGQTALEAAACGRPIVALRGGGIVEVAVDGVNAITVHDAEPDAVAWAIRTVLSDSTRASAMGLAGRALAKSRYSLATQASSWRAWIGGWSAPPVLDEAVVRDSSNPPEGVSSAKGGAR